jgi:hypothetical protein
MGSPRLAQRSLPSTLAACLLSASALAQRPADVVRWTAKAPRAPARPGATLAIELTADPEPGWHLYAATQPAGGPRALTIKGAESQPFDVKSADVDGPPPRIAFDRNFDRDTHYYDEKTTLIVPLTVKRNALPGKRRVTLEVTFQACSDRVCLRPATETVSVDVTVAPATGQQEDRR